MEKDELPVNKFVNMFELTVEGVPLPISCAANQTLLRSLTNGGIFLEANCGGRGTCGKCKIQVLHGTVAGPGSVPAMPEQAGIYLACQVYPCENVTIRLNKAEASAKGNIVETFEDDGQPLLKKVVLTPEYPTVAKHYSLQEMIARAMNTTPPFAENKRIMQQLARVMQVKPDLITVAMVDNDVVVIDVGDTTEYLFGVAFDIGTTTVVGMLVDINQRKIVATQSQTNPQAAFGADVISRIKAAAAEGGLEAEAAAIRQCLNQIVRELCLAAKVLQNHIYAATIAGNSTMEHLLMEISPSSLTSTPYAAVFKELAPVYPEEIGLDINPCGKVIVLPNIASFIGADTTAAVLATNQDISPNQSLLVDLGTNGEMVWGNREKMVACSTAAGPAFEGAHIRDGMRASAGAIADVTIGDDVVVKTVDDSQAVGICGSGIVKAVAELVKKKIITPSGRFDKNIIATLPACLARRLKFSNNQWEFVLVEAAGSVTDRDISITQADVRQIQSVKSAICTGIQILLGKVQPNEDSPIFLAGAFGNYIDIESALTIGLLPTFNKAMVRSVGNAAGVGAVQALLSKEKLARCTIIANKIEYVELAVQPDFQAKFLANLAFPEVLP